MFCSQKGRPIALEAHVSIIIHFLQVPGNYSIDCRIELPESVIISVTILIFLCNIFLNYGSENY